MTDKNPSPATSPIAASIDESRSQVRADDDEASQSKPVGEPTKEEQSKVPVGNYWRIISFGTRTDHLLLLAALVASLASGVALPLMQIVFGDLVGEFNDYFTPGSSSDVGDFDATIDRLALYIFILFLAKFVLCYVSTFCFRTVGLRISAALRLSYMTALFGQPVARLDVISAGAVSNTITSSANAIQVSISDRLAYLFQGIALIVAAYAIAFTYSWSLTLVASSSLLFLVTLYSITVPLALKTQQQIDKSDEKHVSVAGEIFSSIRTVLSLGAERDLSERYYTAVDASEQSGRKLAPWYGIQLGPTFFSIYATFALAFWAGLKFYYEGSISNVNSVVIAFFSVLLVVSILGNVVQPLMYISKAISASTSFFEMIDSEKVVLAGFKAPDVSAYEDLGLMNVTFAYPTRSGVQVLKNFSARFEKGKTTALVGPSGSGKSTIVGLLERWYTLDEHSTEETEQGEKGTIDQLSVVSNLGSVTCGQHNINAFDLKWWRTQIGLVQQEPFLFNDTILANVSFGLLGTQWETSSDEEKFNLVRTACKESFADEFIEKLPRGYDTLVGESGIKLSGGQRQRLAIARSIVRRPSILILDEATSAIDVRSEAIVQKALDNVSKERTTIVIAHRLATIQKADHIIVLRSGIKVEEGTHDELLRLDDGLYHGLVRAQQIQEEATDHEDSAEQPDLLRRQSTTAQSVASHDAEAGPSSSYKSIGFFHTIGNVLAEQRRRWFLVVLMVVAGMGAGASFAMQSWFFAKLIEVFTFTGQRLLDGRNFWALMFFILAIANAFCYGTLGYTSCILQATTTSINRKDYFANTIRQPVAWFDGEDNSSGSIMARLSTDPKNLGEILGINGAFPLISIFNVVSCVIISFYFGWKLTLVVVFAAMPVLLTCQFIKLRNEFYFDKLNAEVFAGSSSFATEAIGAFRTVSSLTMEDTIIEKYSKLLTEQVAASTRRATYATLINAFCDSVELAAMALTFWYGGRLLGRREYNPTQFFVIYVAIIQGSLAAGQFLSAAPSVARASGSANSIRSLRTTNTTAIENPISPNPSSSSSPPPPPTSTLGAAIELSNVSFTYPTRPAAVFRNLSVSIPAGSFVAFVGPSGCGKTSVISLLSRFYEPTSGTITFDNLPVTSMPIQASRASIALVSQEPRLFSGTIRENLILGLPAHRLDAGQTTTNPTANKDAALHAACQSAEIHTFILSLPQGYDTPLGQSTSTSLSGGQKQRLCLARALLRKPKLLLLDEATSSLDSQSEKLVQQAIERLAGHGTEGAAGAQSQGRERKREMTVIAVAHRLATIQKADVIFVFGESEVGLGSKIVERGSHKELMARRGVYWQMCRGQALDR